MPGVSTAFLFLTDALRNDMVNGSLFSDEWTCEVETQTSEKFATFQPKHSIIIQSIRNRMSIFECFCFFYVSVVCLLQFGAVEYKRSLKCHSLESSNLLFVDFIIIKDIGIQGSRKNCFAPMKKRMRLMSLQSKYGVIRGHLPREISRVTKFLLDRGAEMTTVLTSEHYRRSPLVQGGLEIPCRVKIIMVNTKKCSQVLDRYLDLIDTLYTEPNPPVILGSILSDNLIMESETKEKRKCPKSVTATNKMKKMEPKSMDIRKMFLDQGCKTPSQKKKKQEENNVIILD